jgi:hypothetical protein
MMSNQEVTPQNRTPLRLYHSVLTMPSWTVMVPVYSEAVIYSRDYLTQTKESQRKYFFFSFLFLNNNN